MIAYVALLIAMAGLLMWTLAGNPKVQEMGRILFFCGSFVFTWVLGSRTVRLF